MESPGFCVAKASRVGHSDTSGDLTVRSSPFDCAAGDTGIQVSAVIHSIHLHTSPYISRCSAGNNMKQHEATLILTHLGGIRVSCSGTHWPGLLVHEIWYLCPNHRGNMTVRVLLLACRKLDWSTFTHAVGSHIRYISNTTRTEVLNGVE